MSTYTGEGAAAAVMELMEGAGESDGLVATKIVEYRTPEGAVVFGVVWLTDDQDMYERPNPYIINPRVIWTRAQGGQ